MLSSFLPQVCGLSNWLLGIHASTPFLSTILVPVKLFTLSSTQSYQQQMTIAQDIAIISYGWGWGISVLNNCFMASAGHNLKQSIDIYWWHDTCSS